MGYRGWVRDSRVCQFGQKEQVTKTNMYYLTREEAKQAARKILVADKKIFQFVWEFLENNYSSFGDVFPAIAGFPNFSSKCEDENLDLEFLDQLVELDDFDKFLEVYSFLSYGIEKI